MSDFLGHHACPCGKSSDGYGVYSDGHGHCFSCDKHFKGDGTVVEDASSKEKRGLISGGDFRDLVKRNLREDTCRKYGYTVATYKGRAVQVAPYYDKDGHLVAQKVRFPDKDFTVTGDMSKATLFGQKGAQTKGKRLVVTEGEIDCLSVAQAFGLSWPVVSVPNGASGAKKAITKNIEFVEGFDEVVFMFDEDEPGRKAAKECAELLTPGKAKVASLPLKDANEMLKENRVKDLCNAVFNARETRPDGVVNMKDLWDVVSAPVEMATPYPWEGLNEKTYGLRKGELVTWCAGSGVGKSSVTAELAYHLLKTTEDSVAYIALEESQRRTGQRFMGLALDKPIHLPGVEASEEERQRAFQETLGTGRLWSYDHFGSLSSDNLMAKLRYLVKGCGAKWIILDHLSILVSGMDVDSDERRALDRTMTALRSFVEETGAGLQLVSHLRRADGKSHEEGGATSLSQLRGSHAIAQLSDMVIGAERNGQAATEEERNTMTLRVLKNRLAGETGIACHLKYDKQTGRLSETEAPDAAAFPDDGNNDF